MADVTLVLKANNSDYVNKMKEAQVASQKVYDTVEKGAKREKGLIEDIENTLTQLQERRRKAFAIEDIEKYNKKIQEAKKDLEEYEKAGVQAEKTTNTFSQTITKWVLGLGGAAAALRVLSNALKETTAGLDAFNLVGAVTKQVLNDIVSGVGLSIARIREAVLIQKELNKERQQEYIDLKRAKEQQILYNRYYFEAMNRTKTDKERLDSLNKALDAHNKMIELQIENAQRLAKIKEAAFLNAPASETARKEWVAAMNVLDDLEIERTAGIKRIESLRTGIMQEEIDKREKVWADYFAYIDKLNEKADEEERRRNEEAKKEFDQLYLYQRDQFFDYLDDIEKAKEKEKEDEWKFESEWAKKLFDQYKRDREEQKEAYDKQLEDEQKAKEDAEKRKRDAIKETYQIIEESERRIFDIMSIRNDNALNLELETLDKQTKAKLKAAGDDEIKKQKITEDSEAKKAEIEKRYKREQQKIDVKQAIADGILAVIKTYAQFGWPFGLIPAAAMTALVSLNVNAIKSQKFAKGGWTGDGSQKDETGERVAGIVHEKEFVVKKGPAHRFREVLEAINKEDHGMIVNRFNKLSPETLGVTVSAPAVNNSVSVNNNGSNSRLDKVVSEVQRLNNKISRQRQVSIVNGKSIITEGNKTRIIG